MMFRNVEVQLDTASWKRRRVPSQLASLAGTRRVDVGLAMLHTATWTRPPSSKGFDLSDCWAWLRYARAFASSPDLRLRPEWEEIDPHQKTILSDDLGIGFTTQFLLNALDFVDYADTLYVLKVLPGSFRLRSNKKHGPKKSPDYIARDSQGKYSILECKGTQASVAALKDAVEKGKQQKRNVVASSRIQLAHSLVAGLFIPQADSREKATIYVSDPELGNLGNLLSNVSSDDLAIAVTQVSLAKQLALTGFVSLANELTSAPAGELEQLSDTLKASPDFLKIVNDYIEFEIRMPLPPQELDEPILAKATSIRFTASLPQAFYNRLISSKDLRQELLMLSPMSITHRWESISTDNVVKVHSPYDFSFGLIFEGSER